MGAKVIRFVTLGCRLNQAEEAEVAGIFQVKGGWQIDFEGKLDADVVLLRSCAVTRQAERSTLQVLRSIKSKDGAGKIPYVVVTGCATGALDQSELLEAGADLILSKGEEDSTYEQVLELVESGVSPKHLAKVAQAVFPDGEEKELVGSVVIPEVETARHYRLEDPIFRHEKATIKVQDGCDFRCSYCIVPFLRGASVSYPYGEVLNAARKIFERGYRELVVSGCNLACYADGKIMLPELLKSLCEIAAEYSAFISIGSLEPGICDWAIIDVMKAHENFRKFVHLPIQSGDTNVLRLAGRRYTGEEVREILKKYRNSFNDIILGADFITGLPGEDEEAFQKTISLVREIGFERLHVFPYSPRQGTKAIQLGERPSREVAKKRAAILRGLGSPAGG